MTGVLDCPLIVGRERLSPANHNERKRSTGVEWCMKELWKNGYWTGFKSRREVSAKVEDSSGWMRMADLIWTVRGDKG